MTGKAAGSAGVCTTDTCLDSITGSGSSHSFLPIKTEKTDPLRLPPPRVHPRKSSSFFASPALPTVSVTASSHPMPPSTTLCSFPRPLPPPLRSSFLPGPRDTKSNTFRMDRGLADASRAFISSVIHLFLIRDHGPALAKTRVLSPKHFDI